MKISRRQALQLMGIGGLLTFLPNTTRLIGQTQPAGGGRLDLDLVSPINRHPQFGPEFTPDRFDKAHHALFRHNPLNSDDKTKLGAIEPERVPLIIVGGGLSGLFAAYLLREFNPVIVEQDDRFGGNSKGESWRGIDYSIGGAFYMEPETGSPLDQLLREIQTNRSDCRRFREEQTVAIRNHLFFDFWNGQSDSQRKTEFTHLARYFENVWQDKNGLHYPQIPILSASDRTVVHELDDVTFYEHLQRINGGPLHPHIEAAIEYFCWSSFAASMREVSAASGLNFYAAEFGVTRACPGGNAAVAEDLLKSLARTIPSTNFRPDSMVFDVEVAADGVRLAYEDGDQQIHVLFAKAVILACPKFIAKRIITGLDPHRVDCINKLSYRSYVVCNVLLSQRIQPKFYDVYLLPDNPLSKDTYQNARAQGATDVLLGGYSEGPDAASILTLYRSIPYEDPALLASPHIYDQLKNEFEEQLLGTISPLLNIDSKNIAQMRLTRWGHALPVARKGLIRGGVLEEIRKPFRDRVFFIEQDNWALPAFETAAEEAIFWAPHVRKILNS